MYYLFTDGSFVRQVFRPSFSKWAYIVVKDNHVVRKKFGKVHLKKHTAMQAEILAMVEGMRYVYEFMPYVKQIGVHSDCLSLVEAMQGKIAFPARYYHLYGELLFYGKHIGAEYFYVHEEDHRFMKLADELSRR